MSPEGAKRGQPGARRMSSRYRPCGAPLQAIYPPEAYASGYPLTGPSGLEDRHFLGIKFGTSESLRAQSHAAHSPG